LRDDSARAFHGRANRKKDAKPDSLAKCVRACGRGESWGASVRTRASGRTCACAWVRRIEGWQRRSEMSLGEPPKDPFASEMLNYDDRR